jgi:hypothetical protein
MKAQAPPPNSSTPAQRTNPEHEWYVALQCIRRTVEEAQEKASDHGDVTEATLDAMRIACSQSLAGVDPKAVALYMAKLLVTAAAPQLIGPVEMALQQTQQMSAPPNAPGGGGAPILGMGPMGASPGMPAPAGPPGGATAGGIPPVAPAVVAG